MKLPMVFVVGFIVLCIFSALYTGSSKEASGTARGKLETATFAGGCFWCMEPPFDTLDGVISATAGYMGGKEKDPTYEQVSSGTTGHAEAIEIVYEPSESPMGSCWMFSGETSIPPRPTDSLLTEAPGTERLFSPTTP